MKYSIRFDSSSMVLLVFEQGEFEVGSLLGINIPYCLWKKNSIINISRSTHNKDPIFDKLLIEWKKFSGGASGEEIFRFKWKIDPENNELQFPKEHVWTYTDCKIG